MADLVAAGLAGPTAIAVDFAGDLQRVRPVALDEEFDRFLACPALGVEAGVDDEAAGAEGERLEIAEPPDLEIVVEAEFVGELLGIKRPAFAIGRSEEHTSELQSLMRI